jgi:anti-sigma factor RsiW
MAADLTNWTCAQTEERLSDFLDGQLSAEDLASFEQHRAGCANCAALLARVGATVSGMHSMALLEEPPELVRAILDRTTGARDAERVVVAVPAAQPADSERGWFDWLSALAQPQFAYGALAVLVSALVVSQALGIQWRRPTIAELQPDSIYREANRRGHMIYARGTKLVSDSRVVYEIQSAFETESVPESAPQSKPTPARAPGQSEIAPHAEPRGGIHDPNRASRRANFMTRAATEVASLTLGMNSRSLL